MRPQLLIGLLLAAVALGAPPLRGADAAVVPLWDGETDGPEGPAANRFGGGAPIPGEHATVVHTAAVKRSGTGSLRLDTNGTIAAGSFDYVVVPFTGNLPGHVDTRDLSRFAELRLWVRNDTGAPFTLTLELKDHRDSNDHRARRPVALGSGSVWTQLTAPLDLAGWQVTGEPDLSRARFLALVVEASLGSPVSGSIHLDDVVLVEEDGPLDVATTPIDVLAEHLARRQLEGLWGARDRDHGLVPGISAFADLCSTNVLAALLQLVPGAVERGWIPAAEADAWVAQVVATLDALMDDALYLPPRTVDRATLQRVGPEESSVDAAFLALALHRYASLPGLDPGLVSAIEALLARFAWSPFASTSPAGWHLAYRHDTMAMTPGVYDGYSGEPWLVSLAAHLSASDPVPIETLYHSATSRARDHLVDPARAHVVHASTDFRAPFLQWLMPLFVDTSGRGIDGFPAIAHATEPRANAVLYQREAHAALAAAGRGALLQPDAGDDGSGGFYQQFSAWEDFGRPDLLMPWSVTFSFLAEPAVAEPALRGLLAAGLHGPLGLSDSARWTTGAAAPSSYPARHDLWNTALSTLTFAEYLWHESADLAALPEVAAALDRVFPVFRDGFETGDVAAWSSATP